MRKLHGKTKLRRMFALFLSVMLLIVNIPVEAMGESIDGTDSSIIENMEDNPITENPTEEPDGDKKDVNEELASLKFDFSKINANESLIKFLVKDVEVDMNDPVIQQVSKELDNLKIQNPTEDLSSFDTSKVTNMSGMFSYSKATIGYARTQTDADKFNSSSSKPSKLVFVVK